MACVMRSGYPERFTGCSIISSHFACSMCDGRLAISTSSVGALKGAVFGNGADDCACETQGKASNRRNRRCLLMVEG